MTEDLPHIVGTRKSAFSMRKGEIPSFMTPYFWSWHEVWWWWHTKGMLPLECSWFHHPRHVTEAIRLLEEAHVAYWNGKHGA